MTDPNQQQPQWQQPHWQQSNPEQGGAQPAGYGTPAPGAPGAPGAPAAPGYGTPGAPAPYDQPQGPPNPYGQANPYSAQGPYAANQYATGGPVPMSWRSIVSFPLSLIAILFFPPLFGGIAIVLSSLAMKRREKGARVALAIAIGATVLGLILGAIVASQNL